MRKEFKAVCAWGEGIGVLLVNKGYKYLLYDKPSDFDRFTYGLSESGDFELTKEEARNLAHDLLNAAKLCDDMDRSYIEWVEKDKARRGMEDNICLKI